jgi:hypothetical protein
MKTTRALGCRELRKNPMRTRWAGSERGLENAVVRAPSRRLFERCASNRVKASGGSAYQAWQRAPHANDSLPPDRKKDRTIGMTPLALELFVSCSGATTPATDLEPLLRGPPSSARRPRAVLVTAPRSFSSTISRSAPSFRHTADATSNWKRPLSTPVWRPPKT